MQLIIIITRCRVHLKKMLRKYFLFAEQVNFSLIVTPNSKARSFNLDCSSNNTTSATLIHQTSHPGRGREKKKKKHKRKAKMRNIDRNKGTKSRESVITETSDEGETSGSTSGIKPTNRQNGTASPTNEPPSLCLWRATSVPSASLTTDLELDDRTGPYPDRGRTRAHAFT